MGGKKLGFLSVNWCGVPGKFYESSVTVRKLRRLSMVHDIGIDIGCNCICVVNADLRRVFGVFTIGATTFVDVKVGVGSGRL